MRDQALTQIGVSADLIASNVQIHAIPNSAVKNANALAILAEWDDFRTLKLARIHQLMLKPAFAFDGRGILLSASLKAFGFCAFIIAKGERSGMPVPN